jgi:hypothetical protein
MAQLLQKYICDATFACNSAAMHAQGTDADSTPFTKMLSAHADAERVMMIASHMHSKCILQQSGRSQPLLAIALQPRASNKLEQA